MNKSEKEKLLALVADVCAFYRQDFSAFVGRVWLEAMKPYEFAAVADAMNRHCINPDTGQWMPKPADIVKMLGGSTLDTALLAWSKVDKAVRTVGTYQTVVFDDPLIHRVLQDMGGWVPLGTKTDDEWPFVAKEFQNRYRGYAMRSERPEYLPAMIGIAQAQNSRQGLPSQPPVAIGNAAKCLAVYRGGDAKVAIGISPLAVESHALKLVGSEGMAKLKKPKDAA
jgi:hypothetical protein